MTKKFLQLSEYVDFFEKNSVFPHNLRWIIPDKYNNLRYDVSFIVDLPKRWVIKNLSSVDPAVTLPSSELLNYVKSTPIDLTILYSCLHEVVREEAVFAIMTARRIKKFLGDEEVDNAVLEMEEWSKNLLETVNTILNRPQTPPPPPVESKPKSTDRKLRIVDYKEAEKMRKIHIVKDS